MESASTAPVDVHLCPEPLVQRGSRVDDSLHSAGGWRVRGGMAHYIATAAAQQPDLPSNSNLPSPAPGLAASNCALLQTADMRVNLNHPHPP